MNLAEKLMQIDKGDFNKEKRKEITSKMLSDLFGEKTKITIQSVSPQTLLELSESGLDSEGNPIIRKTLETNSLIAAAAIVEPNLKDEELLKHLGVATPAMAALKLLKGEVNMVAAEVNKMAGFGISTEEIDEEIKN
ncbi:MAG: hypothetical protein HFH41_04090 [Lachnospiraceae bacterium]|nr:hypothetical protein [Lachnospiraceae bacterium]